MLSTKEAIELITSLTALVTAIATLADKLKRKQK